MAIDIGQFVQTFFDESLEGLDVMEAGLLALSPGAADLEQINTIFRAAHSIKGGSGAFGFSEVTDFAHAMGTLLDKMREGRLAVTTEAVNTLLESVACLREMLVSLREQTEIDNTQVEALRIRLLKLLEQNEAHETATPRKPSRADWCWNGGRPATRCKSERRTSGAAADSGSIRVSIDKVDAVINLMGELVTTQSMLSALGVDFEMSRLDKLYEALDQLDRNSRDLQEHVMRIRMLPVSSVFSRFPRMVHDISGKLGKQIELLIDGEQTEIDKTVIEKIGDPLVHLVRNSLDHGLEPPEERLEHGKPETGNIMLDAYHKGGGIFIEVADDGRGLNREALLRKGLENGLLKPGEDYSDEQIYELIFHPGLSTAKEISGVSGRGVGMDVVRRNIHDVGGNIQVASEAGRGTKITICLPLTLAIFDGQLVTIGQDCYIIPLLSIIESMQARSEMINRLAGKNEVFHFRGQHLPILRLYELFGVQGAQTDLEKGLLVVVEADGRQVGLFVDDLLGQQQISIKSLEKNFRRVPGVAGATILGDGRVGLILDISGLIRINHAI